MSRFGISPGLVGLFFLAIGLGGCDRGQPKPTSLNATALHLQTSNIEPWADGRRGTNRWVGNPEDSVPVIDVVVPEARSEDEAPIAEASHNAIAEINRRMAGWLLLRDVPPGNSPQPEHIQVSYLTAYVPPGQIDDAAYCSNVSEVRGQAARFRPGPDGRRNHGIAWINLGNGHCNVQTGMVVHQLATALGLDAPFPGFGAKGPATAESMWDALATLYSNPVGTSVEALKPPRPDSSPVGAPSADHEQPKVPYVANP